MALSSIHADNAAQAADWDGPSGEAWTRRQAVQDAMLAPTTRILLEAAQARLGEHVLDIGCGCGETSIALASAAGPSGHVLGLDLSQAMLARARQRAPAGLKLDFLAADATTHAFAPQALDLAASRFGVMFFADPAAAFANIRLGMKAGGRLVFVAWRDAKLNPWLIVALRAATRHAPRLPEQAPDAPGPFSFADEARVAKILTDAGFGAAHFHPYDVEIDLSGGQGFEAGLESAAQIGPASRALRNQDETVRQAARASIREALTPYRRADALPLPGAIWLVEARA